MNKLPRSTPPAPRILPKGRVAAKKEARNGISYVGNNDKRGILNTQKSQEKPDRIMLPNESNSVEEDAVDEKSINFDITAVTSVSDESAVSNFQENDEADAISLTVELAVSKSGETSKSVQDQFLQADGPHIKETVNDDNLSDCTVENSYSTPAKILVFEGNINTNQMKQNLAKETEPESKQCNTESETLVFAKSESPNGSIVEEVSSEGSVEIMSTSHMQRMISITKAAHLQAMKASDIDDEARVVIDAILTAVINHMVKLSQPNTSFEVCNLGKILVALVVSAISIVAVYLVIFYKPREGLNLEPPPT